MEKKRLFRTKKKEDENVDKKILRSKKLIEEAKEKIRLEKKNIRKRKRDEFRKTKFYKFISKTFAFVRVDKDTYSFSEVLVVTILACDFTVAFSVSNIIFELSVKFLSL